MAYSKQTKLYRIPVMGRGDMLTEEDEMRQMTIIDNLLYASTYGCSKCIIEEGSYAVKVENGELKLVVSPIEEFSLLGILNYRLFKSSKKLFCNLYPNSIYYVYAEYTEGLEIDSEAFVLRAYSVKQLEDDFKLYVCSVDTTANKINVDVDKVYAKNILAHTSDRTNPHGKELNQDSINVKQHLSVIGNPIYGSIYDSVLSNGEEGAYYVIKSPYIPLYVTVYPESTDAGNIAWQTTGNTVKITNSGNKDVKLNIKIEVK